MPNQYTQKSKDLSAEVIAAELVRQFGNVSETAKALDVHRSTIVGRIRYNEQLQRVRDEARGELVDLAEHALRLRLEAAIENPKEKRYTAEIIYTLKSQGKGRGWSENPTRQKAISAKNLTINLVEGAKPPALPEEEETIIDHQPKGG